MNGSKFLAGTATAAVKIVPRKRNGTAVLRRFARRRTAVISLALLAALVLTVTIAPLLWKYSYDTVTTDVLVVPSWEHPFGTDAIGRDMLAQVLRGTQRSLLIAAIVAVLSTLIGTAIGIIAGYSGGILDSLLMRFVDLVLMIPLLAVLGLLAVRVGGTESGLLIVAVAIALLFWTPTARIIRGQTLSLSQSDFVESARLVGASTPLILVRHLLPHLVGSIAVVCTTCVAGAIGLEATLSFLGLGIQPPDTSLGLLIKTGVGFAATSGWLFYIPGAVIFIIVLLVHFIGEGIQGAFAADDQS